MWYIYQSSVNQSAKMDADNYPVPAWCDPASAATFSGKNEYGERVKFIAAKVDPEKLNAMPEWCRADYDRATADNANVGDFVVTPHKLS